MGPRRELALTAALAILAVGLVPKTNGAPSDGLADPHIVAGTYTPIEQIPYQISLEKSRSHICGGAIVSQRHVLTAAHCVADEDSYGSLRIRAGSSLQIPYINFFTGVIHEIESIKPHRKYTPVSSDYDIAVIKVKNEFVFNSKVQAIAVPTESEEEFIDYSQLYRVSGWGRTEASSFWLPTWLLSVDISPMSRADCTKAYGNIRAVFPRNICATTKGRETPCYGDSGGPMTHRNKLVGLVSWGWKCDTRYPSVYTNLIDDEIRSFINYNTKV